MNDTTEEFRASRLNDVAKLVAAKVAPEQRATVQAFIERYYGQVDPEDLAERQPADLYGAALSHWNFARKRDPGSARLRVLNPSIEEHGWQSTHTIIEIVNDDMPFLVDSVTMEVNRHGLTLHLITHPLLAVVRDGSGTLTGLAPDSEDVPRESFIHVEIDRTTNPYELKTLETDIARVLGDVRMAVQDWKKMRDKMLAIVADLDALPPRLPADDLAEGKAFLSWLASNHFTILGYRCHDLVVVDGAEALRIVEGSSLGILRETAARGGASNLTILPPEQRAFARLPEL